MRKIIFTLLVILFYSLSIPLFAQTQVGVKVGLNSGAFSPLPNDLEANIKREFGWGIGGFVRLKLPLISLYFQPELILTQKKGTIEGTGNLAGSSVTQTNTHLDIPLLVGVNINAGLIRLNAGPLVSFVLNEKLNGGDEVINTNSLLYGWQAGIGSDINRITIDIRYENIESEYNQGTNNLRPNAFWLTIGYKF